MSKATVAYGRTVRALPLLSAANARTRLQIPLSFFDLILLRRHTDTSVGRGQVGERAATKVPDKVWEESRCWLVSTEMATSDCVFLAPVLCDECPVKRQPLIVQWNCIEEVGHCRPHVHEITDWTLDNVWTRQDSRIAVSLASL